MHEGFVLVVDDDPDVRDALEHLLERRGYAARAVATAAEAIELLERGERPSAVFADVLMPGIIGTSLLTYLQNDADLATIPLAFVTAVPHLTPSGSTAFKKPVSVTALVAFLEDSGVNPSCSRAAPREATAARNARH